MSLFNRKQAEPEDITGTDAMRDLLKARARTWNLGSIAEDISIAITRNSQRTAALDMAKRVAGDGASDIVTATIAKGFAANLSGSGRESGTTGSALEDFMNNKSDLSVVVKQELARVLYGDHVKFDPRLDRMVNTNVAQASPFASNISKSWVNPDARIAAAQAELHAAIQAANPPFEPVKPLPSIQPEASWPPKRPGFAA